MSYCRKLFIVVLLILSLPVQSYAAVSLKCVAVLTEAQLGLGAMHFAEEEAMPDHDHHHEMRAQSLADDTHHPGQSHHAHSCSSCASCCFGAGLPAVPHVAVPVLGTVVATLLPPPARAVSFLTDGIERPPRGLLD